MKTCLRAGLLTSLTLCVVLFSCQTSELATVAPSGSLETNEAPAGSPDPLVPPGASLIQQDPLELFNTFSFGHAFLQEDVQGSTEGASNAQFANGPWILSEWEPYWHDTWLQTFLPGGTNQTKTPYIYGYLVAGLARSEFGLKDCNVGTPNLCQTGAIYLRQNQARITQRYQEISAQIAQTYGTDRPVLFHIEPDFFQYAQTFNTQQQAPLSFAEAQTILNGFIAAVKQGLPNAVIVLDVSPWNPDQAAWFAGMDMDQVSYVGMVGKIFPSDNSVIDANRYSDIAAAAERPIIVNTAYGPGGWSAGYRSAWEERSRLETVAQAGVIGVIQAVQTSDASRYQQVIQGYLTQPVLPGSVPTPSPQPTGTPVPTSTPTLAPTPTPSNSDLTAQFQKQSQWQNGYCGVFSIQNESTQTAANWQLEFSLPYATINSSWSGTFSVQGSQVAVTGLSWNRTLNPGQQTEVGLCAAHQPGEPDVFPQSIRIR